jgi:hypothetical protein
MPIGPTMGWLKTFRRNALARPLLPILTEQSPIFVAQKDHPYEIATAGRNSVEIGEQSRSAGIPYKDVPPVVENHCGQAEAVHKLPHMGPNLGRRHILRRSRRVGDTVCRLPSAVIEQSQIAWEHGGTTRTKENPQSHVILVRSLIPDRTVVHVTLHLVRSGRDGRAAQGP